MKTPNEKATASLIHLSAFAQYFFPLGNFIFPVLIWAARKEESGYVDHHGKQAINFQLSIFVYTLVLALIAVPIFVYTLFKNIPAKAIFSDGDFFIRDFNIENLTGMVALGVTAALAICVLKAAEFFLIVYAAVKASNGESYRYPLTINFLKQAPALESQKEPEIQAESL